jgi:hypothetical protein
MNPRHAGRSVYVNGFLSRRSCSTYLLYWLKKLEWSLPHSTFYVIRVTGAVSIWLNALC